MEPLSSFFGKFSRLIPPERIVRRAAVTAVQRVLEVPIQEQNISVTRDTIVFAVPSTMKSEIMLHEQEILAELNNELRQAGRTITKLR